MLRGSPRKAWFDATLGLVWIAEKASISLLFLAQNSIVDGLKYNQTHFDRFDSYSVSSIDFQGRFGLML